MKLGPTLIFVLAAAHCAGAHAAGAVKDATPDSPYAPWKNGPSIDANYFPIGVWLQSPRNAKRYQQAGINLIIGLWRGPTEEQLAALKAADMRVICSQNTLGLNHKDDPTIAGWLLPDEPDNAQPVKDAKTGKSGYGPPTSPEDVVKRYERTKAADPTRPVMLNLGQGVANEQWIGRGSGATRDDYLTYVKAGDIVSFDVYPVAGVDRPPGHDHLDLVARGVERLVRWSGDEKPVWAILECTHISDPQHKATPQQIRAEAWMALTHGARGIVWFVHEFEPRPNEAALLGDPENLAAVTAINQQAQALASVLNSPTVKDGATVASTAPSVPIAVMTKRHKGETYVFSVAMREGKTRGSFEVAGLPATATAEVIGEDRKIDVKGGKFDDEFDSWGVHLYRIR